jgi:hypothetical protein
MWGNFDAKTFKKSGAWTMTWPHRQNRHSTCSSLHTTLYNPHSSRHLHPPRSLSHSQLTQFAFCPSRISTRTTSPFDADVELPLQAEQRLRLLGRHDECSSVRREPGLAPAFDHSQQRSRCHPSQKAHWPFCAQALSKPSKASSCSSAAKAYRYHQAFGCLCRPGATRTRRRPFHLQ